MRYRIAKSVDPSYAMPILASTLRSIVSLANKGIALKDVQVRFGLLLRQTRQKCGISQEKLAELAGLHRTYVSSVERGERNVSLQNIERLANALDVRMAELMPDNSN